MKSGKEEETGRTKAEGRGRKAGRAWCEVGGRGDTGGRRKGRRMIMRREESMEEKKKEDRKERVGESGKTKRGTRKEWNQR